MSLSIRLALVLALASLAAARPIAPSHVDVTAPATPNITDIGLAAPSSIVLRWDAVEGTAAYDIEWSADGETWGPLATTTEPSFEDRDLPIDATFHYRVIARDEAGRVSQPSVTASARTGLQAAMLDLGLEEAPGERG